MTNEELIEAYGEAVYAYGGEFTEENRLKAVAARQALLDAMAPQVVPSAEAVEEAKRLVDLCTSECLIPADEDGPDRVGYMVGKDDGKSGLYVTPERAFSQSFPKIWAIIQAALGSQGKGGWT